MPIQEVAHVNIAPQGVGIPQMGEIAAAQQPGKRRVSGALGHVVGVDGQIGVERPDWIRQDRDERLRCPITLDLISMAIQRESWDGGGGGQIQRPIHLIGGKDHVSVHAIQHGLPGLSNGVAPVEPNEVVVGGRDYAVQPVNAPGVIEVPVDRPGVRASRRLSSRQGGDAGSRRNQTTHRERRQAPGSGIISIVRKQTQPNLVESDQADQGILVVACGVANHIRYQNRVARLGQLHGRIAAARSQQGTRHCGGGANLLNSRTILRLLNK